MCIGIPMQVVSCNGLLALCEADGEQQTVDLSLVGELPVGSWVLVFLGSAREQLTAEQAKETVDAVNALRSVMRGESVNLDSLFADLVDREPQLPPHLRTYTDKLEES
ncbi:MAG: HypC/HybG/HupF family hydrogenase formation chaperone [Amphritea sp.]|jgi:hydrogenase assembly chaperone HypC/HupF|nr:HypC/HybG/HupF family hydrogenase formation chaperone [Amphritea sp.]